VSELTDGQPLSRLQLSAMFIYVLVGVADGFDLQAIGFLAPAIAETLHSDVRTFGPVFAASLAGLMVGTLAMSLAGDRWGRKRILVVANLALGVFTLATTFVETLPQLTVIRFLTGFALGSTAPNLFAMITELAPKRLERTVACVLSAALPLGVVMAGAVGSLILPLWGWKSVFWVGGVFPILLAAVIAFGLPESMMFLAARGGDQRQILRTVRRFWPSLTLSPSVSFVAALKTSRLPVSQLFLEGRVIVTAMLWLTFAMNLMIIYFIVSWLPTILRGTPLPPNAGIIAITSFGIAGVIGSIVQGLLITKFAAHRVMVLQFGMYVVLALLFPYLAQSVLLVAAFSFAIGLAIQGVQAGLNAFAAGFYPTPIRSTGVGWALGIGRFGSVVGPLVGGLGLAAGWLPAQIFMVSIGPALLAMIAVTMIARRQPLDGGSLQQFSTG